MPQPQGVYQTTATTIHPTHPPGRYDVECSAQVVGVDPSVKHVLGTVALQNAVMEFLQVFSSLSLYPERNVSSSGFDIIG